MANSKSAEKRIRVAERRRLRNKPLRSEARTLVKKAELTIVEGDPVLAAAAVREAISTLDRVKNKGVIHRNNAARRKSRLMAKLNRLESVPATA